MWTERPMDSGAGVAVDQPGADAAVARGGRAPLSRARILAATTDFIDNHCVSELSMRKLGSILGVEAMSLYRYFTSKADLLEGVVASVAAQLSIPAPGEDWREGITRFARSFRDLARRHPGIVSLITGAASGTATAADHPALQPASDAVTASLEAAGFLGEALPRARSAVMGYVLGSTMWLGDQPGRSTADSHTGAMTDAEVDAQFEFGLHALLAGLEAQRDSAQPEAARA